MEDRTKLTLFQGIESGLFSDRQKLTAFKAIEQDVDDSEVADLLGSLSFSTLNSNQSLGDLVDKRRGRDLDKFDYSSGADGKLRSLISFGETSGDKEAILTSLVGEDGFTRDEGGNLALTEKGQLDRGIEYKGKNLIIEDDAFSMKDFSDLAGIAPEVVGSVGGSIVGGILGVPGGLPGIIGGSAVGSATGAATFQAIEEGIEYLLGVQTQTGKEVAKDVAMEAAIAGGLDLVGGTVFAIGRGGTKLATGAVRKGKSLATSPTAQLQQEGLDRALSIIQRGGQPSYESVGAGRAFSYGQKLAEGITQDKTRLTKNINFALNEADNLRKTLNANQTGLDDLGKTLETSGVAQLKALESAQSAAQKSALTSIDDAINFLEKASKEGFEVNDSTLKSINSAFSNFSEVSGKEFQAIDDILSKIIKEEPSILINGQPATRTGGYLKVFDTKTLKAKMDDLLERAGSPNQLDPTVLKIKNTLDDLDGKASFENLSILRKSINDDMFFNGTPSRTVMDQLNVFRTIIDDQMDGLNISTLRGIPKPKTFAKAAKARNKAMDNYRTGIERFERVSDLRIIDNFRKAQREPGLFSDGLARKIIKNDSPERLNYLLRAVDNPEEVRSGLARQYLDDAMTKAGRDLDDPTAFNGQAFYEQIKALKGTGKVLFKENWDQVQKLSKGLRYAKLDNSLDDATLKSIISQQPGDNLVSSLQRLSLAQNNLEEAFKNTAIKKLSDGNLTPEDAARLVINPKMTQTEVSRTLNFFRNDPVALEQIRGLITEDILKYVDQDIFSTKGASAGLSKALDSYKPGVLEKIYSKEHLKNLKELGKDLESLGDFGKEGAIATAGITVGFASNPLKNAGKVAKFSFLGKIFNDTAKLEQYIKFKKSGMSTSQAINQMTQQNAANLSGLQKIAQQAGKVSGLGLAGSGQVARQGVPRAAYNQASDQSTPVPIVTPPQSELFQQDIFSGSPKAPTPAAPLSPIEQIRQEAIRKSNIRQRAAQNPAVASSLLGGLGSADLL